MEQTVSPIPEPKNKRLGLVLIIISAVVLLALVAGSILLWQKTKKQQAEQNTSQTAAEQLSDVQRVNVDGRSKNQVLPVGLPVADGSDKITQSTQSISTENRVQNSYSFETARSISEMYEAYTKYFASNKTELTKNKKTDADFELVSYERGVLLTVRGYWNTEQKITHVNITYLQ